MPNLNNTVLGRLPVAFPSSDPKQREIVGILRTLDEKIAHHEARQKLLQELFRTLLHDLMTAKRRVDHLDIDGLFANSDR